MPAYDIPSILKLGSYCTTFVEFPGPERLKHTMYSQYLYICEVFDDIRLDVIRIGDNRTDTMWYR